MKCGKNQSYIPSLSLSPYTPARGARVRESRGGGGVKEERRERRSSPAACAIFEHVHGSYPAEGFVHARGNSRKWSFCFLLWSIRVSEIRSQPWE